MAACDLNICGFEGQSITDGLELISSALAASIQTTIKRTGAAALRVNLGSGNSGTSSLGGIAATGGNASLARTAQTWYTFYLRVEDLPSITTEIAFVATSGSLKIVNINLESDGDVVLVGTSTSAVVATLSPDTWYRFDLRVTSNGTCGLSISDSAEQTVTGNNQTQDRIFFGRTAATATAIDIYVDDVAISSTGFPGVGGVLQSIPIEAGNDSGWTNGPGSDNWTDVDETPHDTDTTYIGASATQDNLAHVFGMQTAATIGISGNILAVKVYGVCRAESTASTSTVGVRLRSGSTNSDTTGREWTTTYQGYAKVLTTDPNGGGSWTSSGFDGIECGVFAGTLAQAQRCTKVSAMVWSSPANTTVTPSTASLTLTTFAPTVATPRAVTPGTASLTLTGNAPTVTVGKVVTPDSLSLTLTTFAPTVSTPQVVTPGVATLSLTTFAPTVSAPRLVTPGVATLTLTTFAPTVVATNDTPEPEPEPAATSPASGGGGAPLGSRARRTTDFVQFKKRKRRKPDEEKTELYEPEELPEDEAEPDLAEVESAPESEPERVSDNAVQFRLRLILADEAFVMSRGRSLAMWEEILGA